MQCTVFRINNIFWLDKERRLSQVRLTLTTDKDPKSLIESENKITGKLDCVD